MSDTSRILIGIPVYNEAASVPDVLEAVRGYGCDVLVVDDGSTDETPMLLARQAVEVARHAVNRGYGRSMQDMIRWACCGSSSAASRCRSPQPALSTAAASRSVRQRCSDPWPPPW